MQTVSDINIWLLWIFVVSRKTKILWDHFMCRFVLYSGKYGIWTLPHFQSVEMVLRFYPAFWWQDISYMLFSLFAFRPISFLLSELLCFPLCYLCYLPVCIHQWQWPKADLSGSFQAHQIFMDLPKGVFESKVEKWWQ
jgi:hypothetical protein